MAVESEMAVVEVVEVVVEVVDVVDVVVLLHHFCNWSSIRCRRLFSQCITLST